MEEKIIYPELSYQIIGILFDVYNQIGYGHHEKHFQRAMSKAFKEKGIKFKEQVLAPLTYNGALIGKYYLDFVVEDKIAIELKKNERFSRKNIEQMYSYLKATGLKLGILVNFTPSGVKFRRILNIK